VVFEFRVNANGMDWGAIEELPPRLEISSWHKNVAYYVKVLIK